ncbi:putative membrane protein, partial [Dysosmobacter welbionis]
YHLLLRKGRSAVLVLPFEQPQYRKAAVALKGDKVMLDEVFADTGGCQDAGKRAIALQSVRGTDARQHRSGHVTEQKDDIFLSGGEHFCDLHRRYRLSAAGTAPDRQHTAAVILLLRLLCVALKDAGLSEIHPVTSLSGI